MVSFSSTILLFDKSRCWREYNFSEPAQTKTSQLAAKASEKIKSRKKEKKKTAPTLKILNLVVGEVERANVSQNEVEVIQRRDSVERNVQLVEVLQVLEVFNPLKFIATDFKLTQVWSQGLSEGTQARLEGESSHKIKIIRVELSRTKESSNSLSLFLVSDNLRKLDHDLTIIVRESVDAFAKSIKTS